MTSALAVAWKRKAGTWMAITLKFIPPVSAKVRATIKSFIEIVPEVIRLEHDLRVTVLPEAIIRVENDAAFGGFYPGPGPSIVLAGSPEKASGISIEEWCGCVLHILSHELAHYEQFRDGKELTERGVEVRAKSILCMILLEEKVRELRSA